MTGMLAPTRYVKAKAAWNGRPEKWYVRALVFDVIELLLGSLLQDLDLDAGDTVASRRFFKQQEAPCRSAYRLTHHD
jgi:hypothetical protein